MKTLLFDFSKVILFSRDSEYKGFLNDLHKDNSNKLGYDFLEYFRFNDELLDYLGENKEYFEASIFTTGTIQEIKEVQNRIKGLFKNIYAANALGLKKNTKEAYQQICSKLGVHPSAVLFVDDTKKNAEAAYSAGLQAIQYKSIEALLEHLENMKD